MITNEKISKLEIDDEVKKEIISSIEELQKKIKESEKEIEKKEELNKKIEREKNDFKTKLDEYESRNNGQDNKGHNVQYDESNKGHNGQDNGRDNGQDNGRDNGQDDKGHNVQDNESDKGHNGQDNGRHNAKYDEEKKNEYEQNIKELNEKIKAINDEYENKIKCIKNQTIKRALMSAKARNVDAAIALLDTEKIVLGEDGSYSGIDEQIKKLKTDEKTSFMFESEINHGFRGITPGQKGIENDEPPVQKGYEYWKEKLENK